MKETRLHCWKYSFFKIVYSAFLHSGTHFETFLFALFLCLILYCANCIHLLPNWSYVWGGRKCKCMRAWITNNKPYIPGNDGGPSISGEELERPLLSTSGPFDHLPHCQVPPVECFIISPSKCLRLAKSTEALLCTTRCHSGLLGSTGGQQGFREIINRDGLHDSSWSLWPSSLRKLPVAYDKNDSPPSAVLSTHQTFEARHQTTRDIRRNDLTGRRGTILLHSCFCSGSCLAEGNKAWAQ